MPKITETLIERTVANRADKLLWDSLVPGFCVRVSRTGKKSFYVRYRVAGKTNRKSLGDTAIVDLETAREHARKILEAIALGKPISEIIHSPAKGYTVADLSVEHQRVHVCSETTQGLYEIYWRVHTNPEIGSKRIVDLSRLDVIRLHKKIGRETPTTANRVITHLSGAIEAMNGWGSGWPKIPNPAKNVEPFPEDAIERILTADQAKRLHAELDRRVRERPNNSVAWLCMALMMSGLRRDELRPIRWEWLDLEAGTHTIPKTKRQIRRVVHLDEPLIELFHRIPKVGKFVFSNKKGTAPINKPGGQWRRVKKICGIDPKFRLHDLRHTFASVALNGGLSIKEVSELLHHASVQTTMRYIHLLSDQPRAARTRAGAAIAELTASPPGA